MTIAEIHGKLRPHESSEDLLTSDVFGALRYCKPNEGLIPFINQAKPFLDTAKWPIDICDKIVRAEYFFWPRTTNREPDLIIILHSEEKIELAINIEAKYFSYKHNHEDTEVTFGTLSGDQLVSQFQEFTRKPARYNNKALNDKLNSISLDRRYLIFLTMHYVEPSDEINETKIAADKSKSDIGIQLDKFYWLSWNMLPNLLINNQHSLILEDLYKLLLIKGLTQLDAWEFDLSNDLISTSKDLSIYNNDGAEYWCNIVSQNLLSAALKSSFWI